MKPPICEVCDLDFRHQLEKDSSAGGLVYFSDFKSLEGGVSGHPQGTGWFCSRHLADARFLSSLSKSAALTQLKTNYLKYNR